MNSPQVRIAVDATGGDYAPGEVVAGAIRAKEELGIEVILSWRSTADYGISRAARPAQPN